MKTSFFAVAFFAASSVVAQQDSIRQGKFVYFNQFLSGGLFSKSPNAPTLHVATFHGVRYKRISFGGGIGYDAYRYWQTVPILATLATEVTRTGSHALIVQLTAGSGKAWRVNSGDNAFNYHATGDRMFAAAIGYSTGTGQWRLYILAGYRFQRIKYDQTPRWWTWQPTDPMKVVHDMERLSVLLGFGFR